jgi:hypothetical protein
MGTLKVNNIQSTTDGSVTFPQGSVNSSNSIINGNLSVSGTTTTNNIRFQDGSISTPSLSFTNDTNTGLYRISEDKIGVSIGGVRTGEIGSGYGGFTGNIIQVQSTTKSDVFTTTTTGAFLDVPNLFVTITPRYNTSRILVMMSISYICDTGATSFQARVVRDSTPIGIGDTLGSRSRSTVGGQRTNDPANPLTQSIQFLDSPSSTSLLTYKIQVFNQGGTLYVNRSGDSSDDATRSATISNITVMEIQQ